MPTIWRIHNKRDEVPPEKVHQFFLDNNLLGIGWKVCKRPSSKRDYCCQGQKKYAGRHHRGWIAAANAVLKRMDENDLCWSRNSAGNYYLGRITSDWRYRDEQKYKDVDTYNVRDCCWCEVGPVDRVPGLIVNRFRPSRTVQSIPDETANLCSRYLWNTICRRQFQYPLSSPSSIPDLLSLFSPDDCEDIVGAWLQETRGYRVVPSSAKFDTVGYEFVLKRRGPQGRAVVQVKQGKVEWSCAEIEKFKRNFRGHDVYLFATKDTCQREEIYGNVHRLSPQSMLTFAKCEENREILSDRIGHWIDLHRALVDV